jgi:prophage regulatory protein
MTNLLKLEQVIEQTQFSKTTIYKFIAEKNFPKPVKFNGRSSRWIEAEIEVWLAKCIEERDRA